MYDVLRPPLSFFFKTPFAIKSFASLSAVSREHLHIRDQRPVLILPSNPSKSILSILRWRALKSDSLCSSQNFVFCMTDDNVDSVVVKRFNKPK